MLSLPACGRCRGRNFSKNCDDAGSLAGVSISIGIAAYNVLAAVVLLWAAVGLGLGSPLLWGGGVDHAALGLLFIMVLRVGRKQKAPYFFFPSYGSETAILMTWPSGNGS